VSHGRQGLAAASAKMSFDGSGVESMNLLIGANGLAVSHEVLDDLTLAGLPDNVRALALTVIDEDDPRRDDREFRDSLAAEAAARIKSRFPTWETAVNVVVGIPHGEILKGSDEFQADLIAVNHPEVCFGDIDWETRSTAETVLDNADRSVRLIRRRPHGDRAPRIILAFDGSKGSERMVDAVSARKWPSGTLIHVVAVADLDILGSIGRFVPQMKDAAVEAKIVQQWGITLAQTAMDRLSAGGLDVTLDVVIGHAAESVVKQAAGWEADAIFVGPNSRLHPPGRFSRASVSLLIAATAGCSVEVVRGDTK